jgi:hypothetical protein
MFVPKVSEKCFFLTTCRNPLCSNGIGDATASKSVNEGRSEQESVPKKDNDATL